MNLNLLGTQAQGEELAIAIRDNAMAIAHDAVMIFRRYRIWILGGLALLVLSIGGWTLAHRQDENALTPEFRTSAQQAYEAITRCENYRPHRGDSWQVRELDAELSVTGATAVARTHADLRAALALSDYLHQVKLVHVSRQNRDANTARHDVVTSARDLRAAKHKVQTAIDIS